MLPLVLCTPRASRKPVHLSSSRNFPCDDKFNSTVSNIATSILTTGCFKSFLAKNKAESAHPLGRHYSSCAVVGHYNGSITHADAVFVANWHFTGLSVEAHTPFFRFTSRHLGFYQTRNETVVTAYGKKARDADPECKIFPCNFSPTDPRKAYSFHCRGQIDKLWKNFGVRGSPTTGTVLLLLAIRLCKDVRTFGMSFLGGKEKNAKSLLNTARNHYSFPELSVRSKLRECFLIDNADNFR